MNRNKCVFLLFACIFLFSCSTDAKENNSGSIIPTGRRLRVIAEEKSTSREIMIGVACGLWAFDYDCGEHVNNEFNYLTPENDFKQKIIHPDNQTWNFTNSDQWVTKILENDQILRMHCPIGPQVSEWAENDERTGIELETNMIQFLTGICTRYNNIKNIKYMDVVNETVQNGEWFGPKTGAGNNIWENPWPIIGYDDDPNNTPLYIRKAFEIVNQQAPNIKTMYNHHEGPEYSESWNLIKETIIYLRNLGLKIDAIGWQAHVDNGWATIENIQLLEELISWAQDNDLEFHITEASVFIKNDLTDYELNLQAETYATIIETLFANMEIGTIGWNTWHLTDAYTYKSEYYPSIFDDKFFAKPAYYAIQELLESL